MASLKTNIFRSLNQIVRPFLGKRLGRRLPLLKRIHDLIYESLQPKQLELYGQILEFHPKDKILSKSILGKAGFEEFEIELFINSLYEGGVVVDIGANIGYYTTVAASQIASQGHVYAFEPDVENFQILKRNVDRNQHQNVTLMQLAVSNASGELTLYVAPDNRGDHRTYKDTDSDENRSSYQIKAVALDTLPEFANIYPSIIKIDIQGFEFFALQGMKELIKSSNKLSFFTEFWPYGLNNAGLGSAVQYYEELKALDFEIFNIDEGQHRLQRVTDVSLLLGSSNEAAFTNLVCVKGQPAWMQSYFLS